LLTLLPHRFATNFEPTLDSQDVIDLQDLSRYWQASHPGQPATTAQVLRLALYAFKDHAETRESRKTGGIRCLKLKSPDGPAVASKRPKSEVGDEEAENW